MRRRSFGLGLAALLCAASGIKAQPLQGAAAPQAGAAAPAPADPFKFSNDFTLLVNSIKAAKAADFESAWTAIKDKLSKSDKPGLKEMAEIVGVDHVSIGTDQHVTPGSVPDYSQWVHLVAAMLRGGFTPEEAGKIAGGNYMRIFGAAVG